MIPRYARWTDDEVAELRRLFPDHTAREISERTGRGVRSIELKARQLGLRKTSEWIAERARAAMADPSHPARRTQWQTGNAPYNKGKPHPARGRTLETMFQPGHRPHTWMPIGSDRTSKEGYLQRKTAEYRGGEAEGGGMKFGSVCSGIEAASVAWHPLGWQAAWFAEIEPFPCAVLAHHYPTVPNLGDMTTIAKRVMTGEVEAPDVLAGGTPCQAFSVAGLRESLADERGNLTLKFVELADAIDFVRVRDGRPPSVVFWENVPGVLSTKDNAFGCFLAGLAGEDEPLRAPGGKWANAGAVYGPARAIAWRTLDAQYFGLAQRRRRVFVVASARNGFDPATVLFEWDGVRRDSAPSREAGKAATGGAQESFGIRSAHTSSNGWGIQRELTHTLDTASPQIVAQAFGGLIHADPIARCDTAGEAKRQDWETCNFVAHSLRGEGFDASEGGTGRGTPLVPVAFSCKDHGADAGEVAPTLRSMGHNKSHANAGGQVAIAFNARQDPDHWHDRTGPLDTDGSTQAVAFGTTQITSAVNRSNPKPGDPCHPLAAGAHAPAVAFQERGRKDGRSFEVGGDVAYALTAPNGGGRAQERNVLTPTMQVRRLTPRECARLQGFPDDYLSITYRGKPAADGPKYKALGNSWAVPVVRWIGERIHEVACRRIEDAQQADLLEGVK